jgi:hypothetical protein
MAVEVTFDDRHVRLALEFLATGDEEVVARLADLPASQHLLRHARAFEQDVPRESALALARSLVTPRDRREVRVRAAREALAFFDGTLETDARWRAELDRSLPSGDLPRVSLFLTFGYDIGVATPGNASLNAVHPHFQDHAPELRYYAIHECHHAAFMALHPPRPVSEWTTPADLLAQAEYGLQLEGMAVWAAWDLREKEGTLDGDADYVALRDGARIRALEARYLEVHRLLRSQAAAGSPAGEAARGALLSLYGPERILYRLGAHAARAIERARGRAAVVDLVRGGPRAFLEAYLALPDRAWPEVPVSPPSTARGAAEGPPPTRKP